MLVIDILLIIGGAALLGGAATFAGVKLGKRLDRALAERRAKALGKRNAEALKHVHTCVSCEGNVDPEVDIYDHGAWWHRTCWEQALRGDP